jgi:selenocysteine lyase/cysteine desulfurase
MHRRSFFQKSLTALTTAGFGSSVYNNFIDQLWIKNLASYKHIPTDELAGDEDFWSWVRSAYSVSPNVINLNNGGVSPMPIAVQDAMNNYVRLSNEAPSYYMWRILDSGREPLRESLAELAGCDTEEIAINRNSTEGLNSIIFGLDLKAGDEVVLSKYDYPNMMNAWKQREKRDKIKLVWIEEMDFPMENEAEIVKKYTDKFTSATRLVHLTHVINWTGQVLPVRKIADIARQRGIEVLIDGAHSFAQMDYKIPDLGGDYYATSLHKWMCAPFGSGMLYIKKDKISRVWALLSADEPDGTNIRKFESLGTRSFASEMAIGHALDFHNMIGTKRKQARLLHLKNYWSTRVVNLPGVKLMHSLHNQYSCALGHIKIEGVPGSELDTYLWNKYKIHTVGIQYEALDGVRITPNIYTSQKDLDKLVRGIEDFVEMKLGS